MGGLLPLRGFLGAPEEPFWVPPARDLRSESAEPRWPEANSSSRESNAAVGPPPETDTRRNTSEREASFQDTISGMHCTES